VFVTDNGIGIAPANLARIFDAFDQGDSRIPHQFGGLGLGLAISKVLVELLHGTIRAESAGQGEGATFVIELPAHTAVAEDHPLKKPVADVGQSVPLRLLVVEDHPDTARILSRMLRNLGYVVVTANRVSTALEMVHKEAFDLIVSDVGLPDGTGYELMQRVNELHPMKGIAMSGFGMDDDIRRSRESGFSDHLVKPVDVMQLDQAIRRVAGLSD
jgi:CheY-like chemotaxis protein